MIRNTVLACGVLLLLFGCAGQTQRQSAAIGIELITLTYELSARRYQNCLLGIVEPAPEFSGCAGEHQRRVELIQRAHPYIVAAKEVAMVAPDQPADNNLARAREILRSAEIGLLTAVTGVERNKMAWLRDEG